MEEQPPLGPLYWMAGRFTFLNLAMDSEPTAAVDTKPLCLPSCPSSYSCSCREVWTCLWTAARPRRPAPEPT